MNFWDWLGGYALGKGLDWLAAESLPKFENDLYQLVRRETYQAHSIVYQSGSLLTEIGKGVNRTIREIHRAGGLAPTDGRNRMQYMTERIFDRRRAFGVGGSEEAARDRGFNVILFQRRPDDDEPRWEVVARTCVSHYVEYEELPGDGELRKVQDSAEYHVNNRDWPLDSGSWMDLMWVGLDGEPSVWWADKTERGHVEASGDLNNPYDFRQLRDWIGAPLVTHTPGVGGAILVTSARETWTGPNPPEEQTMRAVRGALGSLFSVYAAHDLLPLPKLDPEEVDHRE